MPTLSRRLFFKLAGVMGLTAAGGGVRNARAEPERALSPDRLGVLVDTTVCIGCRNCEWACKDSHGLSTDGLETYDDRTALQNPRRPDEHGLTVINEYSNPDSRIPIDVKFQCMHCDHPACLSACIVGAISKQEKGAVVWDTEKCIGCRYCMVACPFQIPAFQYDEPVKPNIMKCDFCAARTREGKRPACVAICPVEAMTYGPRVDLVKLARERLRKHPERYVDHIYGENEVGGTSWLYLASKEFSKLGFPKLSSSPAPGVSESIQHGIFAYFVPPILLYALLGSIMWMRKEKKDVES